MPTDFSFVHTHIYIYIYIYVYRIRYEGGSRCVENVLVSRMSWLAYTVISLSYCNFFRFPPLFLSEPTVVLCVCVWRADSSGLKNPFHFLSFSLSFP